MMEALNAPGDPVRFSKEMFFFNSPGSAVKTGSRSLRFVFAGVTGPARIRTGDKLKFSAALPLSYRTRFSLTAIIEGLG